MASDEATFVRECQPIGKPWTPLCSTIFQRNVNESWLLNSINKIFIDEAPNQMLTDPLPEKISSLSGDCIRFPAPCQYGLLHACAKTPVAITDTLSLNPSGNQGLCACFTPTNSPQQACNCRGSVRNLFISPCFGSICTINNVRILLYNSSIDEVYIQQQCGSNNYFAESTCVISDILLVGSSAEFGSITLSQRCIGLGNVNEEDGNEEIIENETEFGQVTEIYSPLWFLLITMIMLLAFVLFITTLFLYRREKLPEVIYRYG